MMTSNHLSLGTLDIDIYENEIIFQIMGIIFFHGTVLTPEDKIKKARPPYLTRAHFPFTRILVYNFVNTLCVIHITICIICFFNYCFHIYYIYLYFYWEFGR